MTTIEWIEAFFRFDGEAWMNVFAYCLGGLVTIYVFEFLKKVINKHKKDKTK